MKNIRKFLLLTLVLGLLSTTTSHSFAPVSATYATTKIVLQKAWKIILNYKPLPSKTLSGLGVDPIIKLTYQNGSKWIRSFVKNSAPFKSYKGLMAKYNANGHTINGILNSNKYTPEEKRKIFNIMKQRQYTSDAGGIKIYKSLSKNKRKAYRAKATQYINRLIEKNSSGNSKLLLTIQ
jgi:hypothetical protein